MNLLPSARQMTNSQKLMSHLFSTFCRLCAYFQCIGLGKFAKANSAFQMLQDLNHNPDGSKKVLSHAAGSQI
jgi:hypothetical protein